MFRFCSLLLALCGRLASAQDGRGHLFLLGGMDRWDTSGNGNAQLITMGGGVRDRYCSPGAASRLPHDLTGYGSAYAIVGGNAMICGGGTFEEATDNCYTLTTSGAYGGGGASWVSTEDMSSKRMFPVFTLMNHTTFWVGGGDGTNRTEIYHASSSHGFGSWRPYVDLPAVRREACLAKLNDNEFLFGGGIDEAGQPSKKFWIFDVEKEIWTKAKDIGLGAHPGISGMTCVGMKSHSEKRDRVVLTGGRYATEPNHNEFAYDHLYKTWYSWGQRILKEDRRNAFAVELPRTRDAPGQGFLTKANGDSRILQYVATNGRGDWVDTGYRVGTEWPDYSIAFFFRHCPFHRFEDNQFHHIN